jgi:hypothetical protein
MPASIYLFDPLHTKAVPILKNQQIQKLKIKNSERRSFDAFLSVKKSRGFDGVRSLQIIVNEARVSHGVINE